MLRYFKIGKLHIRVHPSPRGHYWKNSKMVSKIMALFGVKRPSSATMQQWGVWKQDYKQNHKFLYFFTEVVVHRLQNLVCYPKEFVQAIRNAYDNAFCYKTHVLSGTLEMGSWHDYDKRLLNCMFESFCDVVEIEFAGLVSDKYRDPEAAMQYIKEQVSRDMTECEYTSELDRILFFKTVLELYNWWRIERPIRQKQMEEVDCDWKLYNDRESLNYIEDEDMMIKLIKIRGGLWT